MGGADLERAPAAVLFACNLNAVRSPIAECLLKSIAGTRIYVDSCGVRAGEPDGFAIGVMEELGLDLSHHTPKTFDDLEDTSFDLIISLTPEAQHSAVELTRTMAADVEYWPTYDPSDITGSREQRLEGYRQLRDQLKKKIEARFGVKAVAGAEGEGI